MGALEVMFIILVSLFIILMVVGMVVSIRLDLREWKNSQYKEKMYRYKVYIRFSNGVKRQIHLNTPYDKGINLKELLLNVEKDYLDTELTIEEMTLELDTFNGN